MVSQPEHTIRFLAFTFSFTFTVSRPGPCMPTKGKRVRTFLSSEIPARIKHGLGGNLYHPPSGPQA